MLTSMSDAQEHKPKLPRVFGYIWLGFLIVPMGVSFLFVASGLWGAIVPFAFWALAIFYTMQILHRKRQS